MYEIKSKKVIFVPLNFTRTLNTEAWLRTYIISKNIFCTISNFLLLHKVFFSRFFKTSQNSFLECLPRLLANYYFFAFIFPLWWNIFPQCNFTTGFLYIFSSSCLITIFYELIIKNMIMEWAFLAFLTIYICT